MSASDHSGQSGDAKQGEPLSFEQAIARLEAIVHDLEEGQVCLADSLSCYEEGVKLLKQCYKLLESAERRIELCTGLDADGNPVTEPFDETATTQDVDQNVQARTSQSRSRQRSRPAKSPPPTPPGAIGGPADTDIDEARGLF